MYLALGEVYLPVFGLQSQTARLMEPGSVRRLRGHRCNGAVTLLGVPFQATCPAPRSPTRLIQSQHCPGCPALRGWALACVHSPLLTQSQLLSFPAPIDMLKFRALLRAAKAGEW